MWIIRIEYIFYNSLRNCPNDLYFLTPTIVNHLAVDGAGTPAENIAAPVFADWLVGDPKGDVLSEIPPVDDPVKLAEYNSRLQASIKGFEDTYGYTHGQVSHAIMYDMRRLPTEKEPNPNYYATTFEELQPMAFESQQNYEIIKHLYENEWLQLYDTAVHFYLGENDTDDIFAISKCVSELKNENSSVLVQNEIPENIKYRKAFKITAEGVEEI